MRLTRRSFLRMIPSGALATVLAACGIRQQPAPTPTATPDAPSPEPVARRYLQGWRAGDFDAMYSLLSTEAQAMTSRDAFRQRYRQIFDEATIYAFETELVSAGRIDVDDAAADFDVTYRTRLVGDLSYRLRLNMRREQGDWRIAWTPTAILPHLEGENLVRLFSRTSTRGVIYDRNNEVLAAQGAIVTIGVVPGRIEDEATVQALLTNLLGLQPIEIAEKYAGQPEEWFIPIGDVSFETMQQNYDRLAQTAGIAMREKAARSYPQGRTASHIVGYVGAITAEELAAFGERGYEEDDVVGKFGLEQAAEELLAGKKGGRLVVLSPEGDEVATLADVPAQQSCSLHTTVDLGIQRDAEEILGERRGAIVVLEVTSGKVLALASYPRFDPNAMANLLDPQERQAVAQQPGDPLLNRAVQGVYPPGSVFKIVTMGAGLETGLYTAQSGFNCPGFWDRLGILMYCWLRSGHGAIDLFNGLVESCDVVFYEVGLALYNKGKSLLQDFGRRFGFGSVTGIELDEAAGLMPDDAWKRTQFGEGWAPGDTVNLAIGQGFLLVTPLQIARMMAAIANGGTLYRPTLFEYAEDVTGKAARITFSTEVAGRLDLAPEHVTTIQNALARVTQPPRGTARRAFEGLSVSVAGKTGTAETPAEEPHAWFAAYAPVEQPQVAVVAMVENAGEGSQVAAPLVREMVERYFA